MKLLRHPYSLLPSTSKVHKITANCNRTNNVLKPDIITPETYFMLVKSHHLILCFVDLAIFENAESKVATLISAASNPDNTCRMDPAWHPWL